MVAADEKVPESKSTSKKEPVEKGKKAVEKAKAPPGELYAHVCFKPAVSYLSLNLSNGPTIASKKRGDVPPRSITGRKCFEQKPKMISLYSYHHNDIMLV